MTTAVKTKIISVQIDIYKYPMKGSEKPRRDGPVITEVRFLQFFTPFH